MGIKRRLNMPNFMQVFNKIFLFSFLNWLWLPIGPINSMEKAPGPFGSIPVWQPYAKGQC